MTDDELMEAWKRGKLLVTEVDDETRTRILTALDATKTQWRQPWKAVVAEGRET
jgi:hypothetical protein